MTVMAPFLAWDSRSHSGWCWLHLLQLWLHSGRLHLWHQDMLVYRRGAQHATQHTGDNCLGPQATGLSSSTMSPTYVWCSNSLYHYWNHCKPITLPKGLPNILLINHDLYLKRRCNPFSQTFSPPNILLKHKLSPNKELTMNIKDSRVFYKGMNC